VKSLAVQTERATGEVRQQIELIETAMRQSITEIAAGKSAIVESSTSADCIVRSVTQEVRATDAISASVHGAAENAVTVASALKLMQDTIRQTDQATKLVLGFADDLSRRSAEVEEAMSKLFEAAAKRSGVRQFADLSSAPQRKARQIAGR
jgi:methyl-accepting chemotaxis protein